MNLLRILRIIAAAAVFIMISVFFLDSSRMLPNEMHWIAHIQFVPALLGPALPLAAGYLVFTALFGRLYCSVVCPFGIMQDIIARLHWKRKYQFAPRRIWKTLVTYPLLFLFFFGGMFCSTAVTVLDPYSNYGRVVISLVRPVFNAVNGLTGWATYHDFPCTISAVLFAAVMLLLAGVPAFFYGRRYCNLVCPVGTLLGIVAKISPFRIRLNSNCKSCGLCEKTCKGECIDSKNQTVDVSRCVDCFNCLSVCKFHGIGFGYQPADVKRKNSQPSAAGNRRQILKQIAAVCCLPSAACSAAVTPRIIRTIERGGGLSSAYSAAVTPQDGLPTGRSQVGYKLTHPVLPAGAIARRRLNRHCTGCHLCVAKCPANVLTPATTELGLAGFMQPVMKFDRGFCDFDCTVCGEVCPTGAIRRLTKDEKHKTQIGKAVFLKENCVVHTQGTNCGACDEHCPTKAIRMVPVGDPKLHLSIPEIARPEVCVGCGACESICPVRPFKAIYVDGLERHGEAKPASDPNEKQKEVKIDGFGF